MLENKQVNYVFTHLGNEKQKRKWAIIIGTSTWIKM